MPRIGCIPYNRASLIGASRLVGRWVRRLILLATVLLHAFPSRAQYCAYVAGSPVSVINTQLNQLVASIDVSFAVGVAVSPDGTLAYVATKTGDLFVVDTMTNTVVATIPIGTSLNPLSGIALHPDGQRIYVTQPGAGAFGGGVSVVDATSRKVTASIGLEPYPTAIAITPDGHFAYVTKGLFGGVAVINLGTNSVLTRIAVGVDPTGLAIAPDGRRVYVANSASNTISVLDTSTQTIEATIPQQDNPVAVAVAPDGSRAYVANEGTFGGSGGLTVIDTATNSIVAHVSPGGQNPAGVAVAPDGRFVYIAMGGLLTSQIPIMPVVGVVDAAMNQVVATIPLRTRPSAIAVAEVPGGCPVRTPTPDSTRCVGDCHNDHQVTLEEILTIVVIALGDASVFVCREGDANGDGRITIEEILAAVNNALDGCSTAVPTLTPVNRPTLTSPPMSER